MTTVEELTIIALKRSFYLKDSRQRRISTVCSKCAWYRIINGVELCGRRKHWEHLAPDKSGYIDATCPYRINRLSPYPSILANRSVVYLDNIIVELKARGGRPFNG